MGQVVEVLLDQNLAKPLDYAVPENMQPMVQIGMRVEVPLKNSLKKGTISHIKSTSSWPNIKPLSRILPTGDIAPSLWHLAQWMSSYYCTPLQRVLRCFVPVNIRKSVQEKTHFIVKIDRTHEECLQAIASLRKKAPVQADILEKLLQTPKGLPMQELASTAVQSLLKKKMGCKRAHRYGRSSIRRRIFFAKS